MGPALESKLEVGPHLQHSFPLVSIRGYRPILLAGTVLHNSNGEKLALGEETDTVMIKRSS